MSKHESAHIYAKVFNVFNKNITKYQKKLEDNTRRRDIAFAHIVDSKDILYASGYYLDDVLTINAILEEKRIPELRSAAASHWYTKVSKTKYAFIHTDDGRSDLLKTYILSYAYHTQIIEYCKLALTAYQNHQFSQSTIYYFVKHINIGLSNHVLDGGVLKFSSKIGNILLMQEDDSYPKKEVIRWDKSVELKKQLEANNIPIYSNENPDGINWIVKECPDLKVWWIWIRGKNWFHRNNKRFFFRPTKFNCSDKNTFQWALTDCEDSEILNNTKISNMHKTIIMHKRNPLWYLRFPILKYTTYGQPRNNVRGV